MTQCHNIIEQDTGNAKHNSQCSSEFVKINKNIPDL